MVILLLNFGLFYIHYLAVSVWGDSENKCCKYLVGSCIWREQVVKHILQHVAEVCNPNIILNAFPNYPMLVKCCTHHILPDLFTVIYLVKSTNYKGPCLHFALYTCYFISKVSGIYLRTLFHPLWVYVLFLRWRPFTSM